jgi:two-component system response regulator CpxR
MNRLLIIDDDAAFCEKISECLRPAEFEVTSIHCSWDASREIRANGSKYDLIMLSTATSGINGFEVLQRIRSKLDTPVIMVSERCRKMDRIVALEKGADDLLAKNCNFRELLATIRAIFRRTQEPLKNDIVSGPVHERIVIGDIELDTGSRAGFRDGQEIRLTAAEFSFLETLMRGAGRIVTREKVARDVLGRSLAASGRSVDIHLNRIRKKIGSEYNGVERIKTVRGIGFIYKIPNPPTSVSAAPSKN